MINFKPIAPNAFKIISSLIPNKYKNINDFVESLKDINNIDDVYKEIKKHAKITKKDLNDINKYFRIEKIEKLKEIIKEWYSLFDYSKNIDCFEAEKEEEDIVNPVSKVNTEVIEVENIEVQSNSHILSKTSSYIVPHLQENDETLELVEENMLLKSTSSRRSNPETKLEISFSVNKSKIKSITKEEIKELMNKFCLILQIHRIKKSDFSSLFQAKKSLNINEIIAFLENEPFKLDKNESILLSKFLIEPIEDFYEEDIEECSLAHIVTKFEKNSEVWEVLNKEDEEQLDLQLETILTQNKEKLKEAFSKKDTERNATISVNDFIQVLDDFKIILSEKLLNYCKLLFYSYNMEINCVPYLNFLSAYTDNDKSDMSDEEIASIVRIYLEKISENMIKMKLNVRDAFQCDVNGLISFENMKSSLKKLGINDIPSENLTLMLEALVYEGADFNCVSIDELEEILMNYGVGVDDEESVAKSQDTRMEKNYKRDIESDEQYSQSYENEYSENYEESL